MIQDQNYVSDFDKEMKKLIDKKDNGGLLINFTQLSFKSKLITRIMKRHIRRNSNGGRMTAPLINGVHPSHHRTFGSRIRRFDNETYRL